MSRLSSLSFALATLLMVVPLNAQPPLLPINQVQGPDSVSPHLGERVMIEGIVSANYLAESEEEERLEGFFVMEDPDDRDQDAMTSEGIFIYAPDLMATDVGVGHRVRVRGRVVEYTTSSGLSSLTEISSSGEEIAVISTGTQPPTPVRITWPEAGPLDLEPYEGMLLEITTPMTVIENRNVDLFGEYRLAPPAERPEDYTGGRPLQPTSFLQPGPEAYELLEKQLVPSVLYDDGRSTRYPRPPSTVLRTGSVANRLVAVVDERFGSRRLLRVADDGGFTELPRQQSPPRFSDISGEPGGIYVATFNLGNFFRTLDTANDGCGPDRSLRCRGARSTIELNRQRDKLIAALRGLDADIIGLIEVENTPGVDAIGNLVDHLNSGPDSGVYASVETGLIGTDAIRVGIIYRADRVATIGEHAILDQTVDPRFLSGYNRPSLAQTFRTPDNHGTFTLVVNHFKSKGSDCDEIGDPDRRDGQGNCNGTRRGAAEALVDWIAGDPTGSGDPDYLLTGDFNAYQLEDPIEAIRRGPDDVSGSADDIIRLSLRGSVLSPPVGYTYTFDGMIGALDHAFASPSLITQLRGAGVWHINSEEADIFDYTIGSRTAEQIGLYRPDPYRSSDHDPILVGLILQNDSATVSVDSEIVMPEELDLGSLELPSGTSIGLPVEDDNPGLLPRFIVVLPGNLEEEPW